LRVHAVVDVGAELGGDGVVEECFHHGIIAFTTFYR
jgi:hypothetical protein